MKKLLLAAFLAAAIPANAQVVPFGTLGGGGGSSSIISGTTPISGGGTTQLCFNDAAFLSCGDAGFVFNKTTDVATLLGGLTVGSTTTAGTGTHIIDGTLGGASATDNLYNLTTTFPATLSAETNALNLVITGDNDAQDQNGLKITMNQLAATTTSGALKVVATGAVDAPAAIFENQSTVSGTVRTYGLIGNVTAAGNNQVRQYGVYGVTGGVSGLGIGVAGVGGPSTLRNTGVMGWGDSDGSSGGVGVWAGISSAPPVLGVDLAVNNFSFKAGLVATNLTIAAPIAIFTDNVTAVSTTAAWAGTQVVDGGQVQIGNGVLTSATMTPTITAEARTVTHSYAWTNAMVTALGAVLTGDITVATLPAKTRVDGALVVIDTAAGGVTTLTVSCGDAIGGAPFNQYIVASDAKAAANTVYGDLISGAETGTALFDATTKWFPNYVPSYTTTTLVTCRFISTGTNLNTVTTSTGRVILTTTLLP